MTHPRHEDEPLTAGVIGLGMIGGGVAVNLVRAGIPTAVFDVRPDASEQLDGVGPQRATPADVARASDVVMVAVVNAQQAREVLLGDDGLLSTGQQGLVVVLLSTLAVSVVQDLAAVANAHGATLLDAGVTQAGEGLLVTMVGGPPDAVARVRPVLDAFSKVVVHCGPTGAGMVTKIARNVITYAGWAAVREATAIAAAGGVTPDKVLEVMQRASTEATSPVGTLARQVAGTPLSTEQVSFVDGLAQKDLSAAQELAGASRLQTPITDVVRPAIPATLAGQFREEIPAGARERGLQTMDRVYGTPLSERLGAIDSPAAVDMVENLFGEVWSRAHLTTRDRRLILLGSTTMIGRSDLLEVQLRGALANHEFTLAQLREVELFLNHYAGVENGTSFQAALRTVLAEVDLT